MMKVTDEMLMALADGELDPTAALEVARAAETDPELTKRLDEFRRTRTLAKEAYADVLEARVPERLMKMARRPRRVSAGWLDWRTPMLPAGIAVAASIAGFALALMVMRAGPVSHLLPSQEEIALALDDAASGQKVALGDNRSIEPTATYVTPGGVCRMFRVSGATDDAPAWAGVACRHDNRWLVEIAVAEGVSGGGDYSPASDRAAQSIDTFLDATGAGESLDGPAEEQLRKDGWQEKR